jgi:DNA-binding transcriptional regulator GbsR (MarR family)
MSDFGISEGIKSVSGAMHGTREATKGLTKSIEAVQKDAVDVARQRIEAKRKSQQVKPDHTVLRAYNEYTLLLEVKKLEEKMKEEVTKKYGAKAWNEIQAIKTRMLKEEKENQVEYQDELKKVRRVQFYCFLAATWIAWYLTWGYKG